MPSFRERLEEAEALLLQAEERPEGERIWLLAVVCELLGDLIADIDAADPPTMGDSTIDQSAAPGRSSQQPT